MLAGDHSSCDGMTTSVRPTGLSDAKPLEQPEREYIEPAVNVAIYTSGLAKAAAPTAAFLFVLWHLPHFGSRPCRDAARKNVMGQAIRKIKMQSAIRPTLAGSFAILVAIAVFAVIAAMRSY